MSAKPPRKTLQAKGAKKNFGGLVRPAPHVDYDTSEVTHPDDDIEMMVSFVCSRLAMMITTMKCQDWSYLRSL